MKYLKDTFFFLLLIILISGMAVVMWKTIYPYNPIRIDSLIVNQTEAVVGDRICIQIVGEKFMPIPVHVSIELINSVGIAIMNYDSNVPVGITFKPRCFNIPMHVDTATYRVRWTGTYVVNEFRHITKMVYSGPIHITNHWYRGEQGKQGIQGVQGKQGIQGKRGGVSLFGKGF